MKKIIGTFFILGLLVSCSQEKNEGENPEFDSSFLNNPTKVEFEHEEFDFGEVESGDAVKHTFSFTNVGDKPFQISNVKATCGCTVPETWPKEPIPPGKSGDIELIYNSTGSGPVAKTLKVSGNFEREPNHVVLTIKGKVLSK